MESVANVILKGIFDEESKFYGTCLIYGMDVEGQFDEACRVLFALLIVSKGQTFKLSDLWDLDLWKLRKKMQALSRGKSGILFKGWKNHLRNSIFHMRFHYDRGSKMMHFEDARAGRVTYRHNYLLDEFQRLTRLVGDVTLLIMHMLMIIGVNDMAFARDPFEGT